MTTMSLTRAEYLEALKRQRDRIASGIPLKAHDDNTPGNKSVGVSWGLCSKEVEAWPTPELHLFPADFISRGHVAPKYRKENQSCPFDARGPGKNNKLRNGCFYTCMVFKQEYKTPTREEAIALYDKRIAEVERHINGGDS